MRFDPHPEYPRSYQGSAEISPPLGTAEHNRQGDGSLSFEYWPQNSSKKSFEMPLKPICGRINEEVISVEMLHHPRLHFVLA